MHGIRARVDKARLKVVGVSRRSPMGLVAARPKKRPTGGSTDTIHVPLPLSRRGRKAFLPFFTKRSLIAS